MRRPAALAAALLAGASLAGPAVACTSDEAAGRTAMPETVVEGGGSIARAGFDGPTSRYTHAILGDGIEATELWVLVREADGTCRRASVALDADHVFEDLAPRLFDLDGDGASEIVVVRTHMQRGGQLAIYGLRGADLQLLAFTPYIGRTRRWLAPIGAADLNRDGITEIAYIDRPHLARTLMVWAYEPDGQGGARLRQVAAASGLTNHRIGEDFITGGIRDCGDGPEIVTADADWTRVMATRLTPENRLEARDLAPFSPQAVARALACF